MDLWHKAEAHNQDAEDEAHSFMRIGCFTDSG